METLIYCECCDAHRPLRIDYMSTDDLNRPRVWGDLCCGQCDLVIATLTVPTHGVYEFTKVRD